MTISLGCDHGGFALKEHIKAYLEGKGHTVKDCGTYSTDSCDYPLFGKAAAEAVGNGECEKGIVICTTGIGISITANKVKGIRCAMRTAVEAGRGMEVNTCRGRTVKDWKPILELYRDCGGEIITVGSDAHAPQNVANGEEEAYALLQEVGFRYVTTFQRRTPTFHKL